MENGQIAIAGQQLDTGQVAFYGSLTMGDFHERSDIDIAVCIFLLMETQNSWTTSTRTEWYYMPKVDNYKRTLRQLEQAMDVYTTSPDDALYRDRPFQRFAFTIELPVPRNLRQADSAGKVLA